MIFLNTINHDFSYEVSDIIRMYFGKEDISINDDKALVNNQSFIQADHVSISSELSFSGNKVLCISRILSDKIVAEKSEEVMLDFDSEKILKRLVKRSMYMLLSKAFNKSYPWGILTGIRPIKLVHELMDKNMSREAIKDELIVNYLISMDRAELACQIAEIERPYIYPINENTVSVYIGIPFCPTRCHYCSFTSNTLKTCGKYVDDYIDALILEIKPVAAYIKSKNIAVQTLYIGGGTPTSINHNQMKKLMDCINDSFGASFEEFTCEAGRPDTIDRDKLIVMKDGGVTRLSINPQTMNQETLMAIGREHSVQQIISSFQLARDLGFNNINMDIILGLPGEGMEHLKNTLRQINELDPESITVHTMAIKRASILHEKDNNKLMESNVAENMMIYCMEHMKSNALQPYYLYRQKHMMHNLENIGFCKKGYEGIYNMQIIEEKQTNIAFGADAVTKAVFTEENRIERQHNIKDLRLYIRNVNEMVEKKLTLLNALWGE